MCPELSTESRKVAMGSVTPPEPIPPVSQHPARPTCLMLKENCNKEKMPQDPRNGRLGLMLFLTGSVISTRGP